MKNKIFTSFIIMLLISSIATFIAIADEQNEYERKIITLNDGYILDQMQTKASHYVSVTNNIWFAQSFKPSMLTLAKIRLYIQSDGEITEPLEVSIRKELTGQDLTYISKSSDNIPDIETWVDFNFPDITVDIDETYYIIVRTTSTEYEYQWLLIENTDIDGYDRGESWVSIDSDTSWSNLAPEAFSDFCFKTYSYTGNQPDLDCTGVLGWPDQKTGSTAEGSFKVSNIGAEFSLLCWEIESYPEWGEWTFTPMIGEDQTPEDGEVTVQVSVIAPDEQSMNYEGEIKIINIHNNTDYDTIKIMLSTPKTKQNNIQNHIILQKIFERFKILEYIIKNIF